MIACTGNAFSPVGFPPSFTTLPPGSQIPTADIFLYFSRLSPTVGVGKASEALLLVDDPGSGGPSYGNTLPQRPCNSPLNGGAPGGCTEWVGITVPTVFAAQSQYPGLDQVNLRLPTGLAGAGLVNITFAVDGQLAPLPP